MVVISIKFSWHAIQHVGAHTYHLFKKKAQCESDQQVPIHVASNGCVCEKEQFFGMGDFDCSKAKQPSDSRRGWRRPPPPSHTLLLGTFNKKFMSFTHPKTRANTVESNAFTNKKSKSATIFLVNLKERTWTCRPSANFCDTCAQNDCS